MRRTRPRLWTAVCVAASLAVAPAAAQDVVRFLKYAEVRDALSAFGRAEDEAAWDAWVRSQDRDIRGRIERGVEDSVSNLVLFGSFTTLARLNAPEAAVDSAGELIPAAVARVKAAAIALSHPAQGNERLRFAHDFLAAHGVPPRDVETTLAARLKRFAVEQRGYQEKLREANHQGDPDRELFLHSTLFDQRGLSVDTSLLPNLALQETLAAMLRKNAVTKGQIRRVALIGPGLDFSDKRDGYDFYPLQTIQPFAILEAVLRLGLARPGALHLVTLDLNPAVTSHIREAVRRARSGTPYVLQLPRDPSAGWTEQATDYWDRFGELLGKPAAAATAPPGLSVRAVAIRPEVTLAIEPRDLNIVAQTLQDARFDLVVATNILVYYSRFEQVLAMHSIARMLNPGGIFLSNTVLPAQRPAELDYLGRRSISYTASGAYGDSIVAYRRK